MLAKCYVRSMNHVDAQSRREDKAAHNPLGARARVVVSDRTKSAKCFVKQRLKPQGRFVFWLPSRSGWISTIKPYNQNASRLRQIDTMINGTWTSTTVDVADFRWYVLPAVVQHTGMQHLDNGQVFSNEWQFYGAEGTNMVSVLSDTGNCSSKSRAVLNCCDVTTRNHSMWSKRKLDLRKMILLLWYAVQFPSLFSSKYDRRGRQNICVAILEDYWQCDLPSRSSESVAPFQKVQQCRNFDQCQLSSKHHVRRYWYCADEMPHIQNIAYFW